MSSTENALLPQMESFQRVLDIPVVGLAISKSASTYNRVKDSNHLVHWALSTTESTLTSAKKQAAPIAMPIAKKLETPIHYVDRTLCRGLDEIEKKVPLVKETPDRIIENAYMSAIEKITHANQIMVNQATTFKDISWNKINQFLNTHYGTVAIQSIDSTAIVVDKFVDKYFPPIGEEQKTDLPSLENDKLLHALQTFGRLSNKTARRLYAHIVLRLKTLKNENLNSYIFSLVEFLQVMQHLNSVSDKGDLKDNTDQ